MSIVSYTAGGVASGWEVMALLGFGKVSSGSVHTLCMEVYIVMDNGTGRCNDPYSLSVESTHAKRQCAK